MGNAIRWTQEMLDAFNQRTTGGRRATDPPVAAPAEPKRSKYGNEKVVAGGVKHDSRKEAMRWLQLEQMQRNGIITDLARQVSFELAPAVRLAGERRQKPPLRYIADFTYMHKGQLAIEDVKSEATRKNDAYRIKKHLMKSVLNLDITEV